MSKDLMSTTDRLKRDIGNQFAGAVLREIKERPTHVAVSGNETNGFEVAVHVSGLDKQAVLEKFFAATQDETFRQVTVTKELHAPINKVTIIVTPSSRQPIP
jgi:hypothetical protein